MKSFLTKLFLFAFVALSATSCVKAALEDAVVELEKDLNEADSKTELVVENND